MSLIFHNPIPFHALFDESGIDPSGGLSRRLTEGADIMYPNGLEPRQIIEGADFIFAVDVNTKRHALCYGRPLYESWLEGPLVEEPDDEPPANGVAIELDMETNEVERLLAVIRTVKGHDDYLGFRP